MTRELLGEVVALAHQAGFICLATANAEGMPHITAAGSLERGAQGELLIKEWFCPGTVANLQTNSAVAVAVWDLRRDVGYQLLGHVDRIEDLAVTDGYAPQVESKHVLPQVEKQLVIHVEKILDFTLAPHCDVPAEAAAD
ncbi:MAG: pyridoxamine 5'-phosphate oxidase family protein [Phycisphaerae bacterium]|nr:pyridoxamine 5'-phosphate oxidase family protein [Phycisphaerae bacterium]